MKFFNIIVYIFIVLLLFTQCNSNDNNIIERDKFIDLLVDMHVSDAILANKGYYDGNLKDSTKSYYNYFLKKYNISRATFDKSLAYYNKDGKDYLKMYDIVVSRIADRVPKTLHKESIYAFISVLVEDAKNLSNLKDYYGKSGKTLWNVAKENELPRDTAKIPILFSSKIKYPCKIEFSCDLKIDSINICNDMNIQMQIEYKDKSKQTDTVHVHYTNDTWKTYKLNANTDSVKMLKSINVNIANCKGDEKTIPKFAIKNVLLKQFALEK